MEYADDGDIDKRLVVYPRAQLENLQVSFSGSLVEAENIERNDMDFIVNEMKKEHKDFTSKNSKYLYIEKIDRNYCLLFSVDIDRNSTIEVLSSIYTYDENQIFVLSNPKKRSILHSSSRLSTNMYYCYSRNARPEQK